MYPSQYVLLFIKLKYLNLYFSQNFLHYIAPPVAKPVVVTLKTGRREVPGSNPGSACRPSRSEFFVLFSETRVNAD